MYSLSEKGGKLSIKFRPRIRVFREKFANSQILQVTKLRNMKKEYKLTALVQNYHSWLKIFRERRG